MDKYIGFKMIQATPMGRKAYEDEVRTKRGASYLVNSFSEEPDRPGYKVVYPDGYESWSPKDVFEKAYMQVGDKNTITQDNVDNFIKEMEILTIGDKTTLVTVELVNGFVITESSSCVDPANYDENMDADICLKKIEDKIWGHLGFLLQTAKEGVK